MNTAEIHNCYNSESCYCVTYIYLNRTIRFQTYSSVAYTITEIIKWKDIHIKFNPGSSTTITKYCARLGYIDYYPEQHCAIVVDENCCIRDITIEIYFVCSSIIASSRTLVMCGWVRGDENVWGQILLSTAREVCGKLVDGNCSLFIQCLNKWNNRRIIKSALCHSTTQPQTGYHLNHQSVTNIHLKNPKLWYHCSLKRLI